MIEHYRYKKRRKSPPVNVRKSPRAASEGEQLSGSVHGYAASAIEERFARGLDRFQLTYYFRMPINAERGMPGWKELDFLVFHIGVWPIEVEDVTYIHKGTTGEDMLKDQLTMEALKDYNPYPVTHVTNYELETQEIADNTVRRIFGL